MHTRLLSTHLPQSSFPLDFGVSSVDHKISALGSYAASSPAYVSHCDFTLPLATLVKQFVAELHALRLIESNKLCRV